MNLSAAAPSVIGIEIDFVANGRTGRIEDLRLAEPEGLRPATSVERAALEEGVIEALELTDPNWACRSRYAGTLRVCFTDGSVDLQYAERPANDSSNCKELTVAC